MRGPGGKRRQRAVTMTDREWERIGARAQAAGMPVSRYIAHRLAGPVETRAAGASPDLLLRVLREVMILSRIEQQRMANREGEEETWVKVAALVDEALAAEEGIE